MIAKKMSKKIVVPEHHLIKNTRVINCIRQTHHKRNILLLLLSSGNTPASQKYFGKVFLNENFDWKKIYYQE